MVDSRLALWTQDSHKQARQVSLNSLGGRTLKFVLYVKFLFIFEARILVLFFFFFFFKGGW